MSILNQSLSNSNQNFFNYTIQPMAASAPLVEEEELALIPLEKPPQSPTLELSAINSNRAITPTGWFKQESTVKKTGKVFAGTGLVTLGAAVYAGIWFTATPVAVLGTVAFLGIKALAWGTAAGILLSKKEFWEDPEFRKKKAREIAEKILDEKMSYPEILENYGELIKKHKLFTDEDINVLVRDDLVSMPYRAFVAKHGYELVKILTPQHIDILKSHFLREMRTNIRFMTSYKELKTGQDLKLLNITDEDLQNSLQIDLLHNDYLFFIQHHGKEVIHALNAVNLHILKDRFISYLFWQCPYGVTYILKNFDLECRTFEIGETALASLVLRKQYEQLQQGTITYFDFRKNNSGDRFFDYLPPEYLEALKPKFLEELRRGIHLGMISIQKDYSKDCSLLQVTQEELMQIILPQELDKLKSANINYTQLIERNGDCIPFLIAQDVENTKILREHYLKLPLGEMDVSCRTLLGISDEDIKKALERDFLHMSYTGPNGFLAKHGRTAWEEQILGGDHKANAKNKMLQEIERGGYPLARSHVADLNLFEIHMPEIEALLQQDLARMDYPQFIQKHSFNAIDLGLFSDDFIQEVRKKFMAFSLTTGMIENFANNYRKDMEVLDISLRDLLWNYWNARSLETILNETYSFFQRQIESGLFTSRDWTYKALQEMSGKTVKDILKSSLKYALDLGIVRREDVLPEQLTLQQRLEIEVMSITDFDLLLRQYGENLFIYQFLTKDSFKMKSLVVAHVIKHLDSMYEDSIPALKVLEKYKLIAEEVVRVILLSRKQMRETLSLKKMAIDGAQQSFEKGCSAAYNQAQSNKEDHRRIFASVLAEHDKALKALDTYKERISELNQQIGKLHKRKDKYEDAKIIEEISALNAQIQELQTKIADPDYKKNQADLEEEIVNLKKKLEETKTATGLVEAWNKLGADSKVTKELTEAENKLKKLQGIPKVIEELQEKVKAKEQFRGEAGSQLEAIQKEIRSKEQERNTWREELKDSEHGFNQVKAKYQIASNSLDFELNRWQSWFAAQKQSLKASLEVELARLEALFNKEISSIKFELINELKRL